jgi:methylmalonyl-CoA/ethylmalonyl-CoA epimerase
MKLNHVGIVVENIGQSAALYQKFFGLEPLSEIVRDDYQGVNVQFLGSDADGTTVELIEPLPGASPARNALEKGGGLNHLCFEVPDINEALARVEGFGVVRVRPPTPAPAFGGRPVAFLLFRGIGLVEFVEIASS